MSKAYVLHGSGETALMKRVLCRDEARELQRVLELNHDLLPGEQIQPEDPCRWLLIRREIPVQDPNSGDSRWNLDFLFADQNAVPTLVECKRFADMRARRDIIGQLFEYAANGQYYWEKELLREYARRSAEQRGSSLEEALDALMPTGGAGVDEYFELLHRNLLDCRMRLVFFLDQSPMELRSVVEFLNRLMPSVDLLIVEARQYEHKGTTYVQPSLFGYSEEARRRKRPRADAPSLPGRRWDEQQFLAQAQETLGQEGAQVLARLMRAGIEAGYLLRWGQGRNDGSFKLCHPLLPTRALFAAYTNGSFWTPYGTFGDTEPQGLVEAQLVGVIEQALSLGLDGPGKKHKTVKYEEWRPREAQLAEGLRAVFAALSGGLLGGAA